MKVKLSNIVFNKNIVYFLFIPLIIIGKVVRYTLMKNVLVDVGIGHNWINSILYDNLKFTFFQSEVTTSTRGNAIAFFQRINILNISTYIGWEIFISILFNLIILLIVFKVKNKLNLEQFLFLCLSITVLNIFDFCLAKEPVQMLYFIFIFIVLLNKKINCKLKYILSFLIIVFSAATLRNYYFIIAFFLLLSTIICNVFILKKEKVKFKDLLLILLLIGLSFYILLRVAKIVSPEDFSELIRVRNRTSSARTDIRNFIQSSNLIMFTLNYLITVIRLIFPIELLLMGPKYLPYILYQIFMSYFFIKNLKNIRVNNKIKNISLYIYIGFVLGSAAFEPDFGSWIRHEAILFPIILFNCDSIKNVKEICNE